MSTTERTPSTVPTHAQSASAREAADDLRATADDLAADARRVAAIEETKARLDPADPKLVPLARESERLTAKMATKAAVETALAEETVDALGDHAGSPAVGNPRGRHGDGPGPR